MCFILVRNRFVTICILMQSTIRAISMNVGRECETMEFKESISQLDKGLKSLSAMLNRRNHGTVYFGVDDSGDVIGMDIGRDTPESIRNLARSRIQPQILPEVTVHDTDDGRRCIVLHASGYDTPYSYDGRYFIRDVSSDESAGPEIVTQLVLARGADPLKDRVSDVQDLTFDLLFMIMSSRSLHPKAEGILRNDGTNRRSRWVVLRSSPRSVMDHLLSNSQSIRLRILIPSSSPNPNLSNVSTVFGQLSLIALKGRTSILYVSSDSIVSQI